MLAARPITLYSCEERKNLEDMKTTNGIYIPMSALSGIDGSFWDESRLQLTNRNIRKDLNLPYSLFDE